MAWPTQAQKSATMKTAAAGLGGTDPDGAARAVATFWSEVLVTSLLNSDDPAIKARVKALGDEATSIMKALVASL